MKLMTKEKGPIPLLILLFVLIIQLVIYNYALFQVIDIFFINWVGYVLIATSLLMLISPLLEFRKQKTTAIVFKKSTTLITIKLYALTRNPMYMGMFILLLGIGLLSGNIGSIITAFLFIPIMNYRIIKHEEIMLENEFQDEYNLYKKKVRRWI